MRLGEHRLPTPSLQGLLHRPPPRHQQRALEFISNAEKAAKGSHIPWWPWEVKATLTSSDSTFPVGEGSHSFCWASDLPLLPRLGFLTPFYSTAGFTGTLGFARSGRNDFPDTHLREKSLNVLSVYKHPEYTTDSQRLHLPSSS